MVLALSLKCFVLYAGTDVMNRFALGMMH